MQARIALFAEDRLRFSPIPVTINDEAGYFTHPTGHMNVDGREVKFENEDEGRWVLATDEEAHMIGIYWVEAGRYHFTPIGWSKRPCPSDPDQA